MKKIDQFPYKGLCFSKLVGLRRSFARKTFSMLLNGKSGISPEMALRLWKVFGRTPEGWIRLQLQYDL